MANVVKMDKVVSAIIILLGLFGLFVFRDAYPVVRLLYASLGMIFIIKIAAVIWQISDGARFESKLGFFLFMFGWPGVSVEGFTQRGQIPAHTGERFLECWLTFLLGCGLLLLSSVLGQGQSIFFNYLALFSILLIVHLGLMEIIADGYRLLGFNPSSLFLRPYFSVSLRDFWSHRWNKAFVDMNKLFILGTFKDKIPAGILTFSIFVISGLLHEMSISYPDGHSHGFPLVYFVIQGLGIILEKKIKFTRFLVLLWVVLPVPLLFTPWFTRLFLGDLSILVFETLFQLDMDSYFNLGLLLGGTFHLLVLCASVQVPGKLNWKEEFSRLSHLNRKITWTYGGYIFAIILFLSFMSFTLSRETLSEANTATLLWLIFTSCFWWARLIIDTFFMTHSDWPQGPLFTIGHICLTTLFLALAILYSGLSLLLVLYT